MSPGLALSRPLGGSRVRWPAVMATSHRTLHHGDAEQRRRRPQRALLHPVRLPSPIGSLPRSSQTARHSLCRAVWRNPRVCPQPMCSWQRDSTACTGTLPHSGCVLRPERTFLTARLPAAPCGAPPPPETPMDFRCPMPLRTHLPLAAQRYCGGTRPVRVPNVNPR